MSKMLEQAIIDAEALKEAALKNAEQAILEKYSKEVKSAVENLLEQPEEPPAMDLGMDPAAGAVEDAEGDFAQDMPRADTDEDDLCPCPDEEEEIEINFDELAAQLDAEMTDHEELADEVEGEEGLPPEEEEEEELALTEDDDFEFDEDFINQIMEKLTLDINPVPSGQPGGASNKVLEREIEDIVLARQAVDEDEEVDAEKEQLEEQLQNVNNQNNELLEENKRFKKLLTEAKNKLEEVNSSNAKLYYTNKVLGSTSLNGRQKNKIVEAISKTSSVEEAKIVCETLQNAVGDQRKRAPKSLSEVVKRSSTTIPPRNEEKNHSTPASDRWRILAGINKK